MDYTKLTLPEVRAAIEEMASRAETAFGGLQPVQLNWKPDASQWSVAQCLEHLLKANTLMRGAADEALRAGRSRSVWQRIPILPGVFGRMLIRSQAPENLRKFTASSIARPSASDVGADIVQRFAAGERELSAWLARLDPDAAMRAVMASPFIRIITYSVLDGCRLIVAHDRRHFEQARRVARAPGFPGAADHQAAATAR